MIEEEIDVGSDGRVQPRSLCSGLKTVQTFEQRWPVTPGDAGGQEPFGHVLAQKWDTSPPRWHVGHEGW